MEQKTEEAKQGAGAEEEAIGEETGTPEGPQLLPDGAGADRPPDEEPGPDNHRL